MSRRISFTTALAVFLVLAPPALPAAGAHEWPSAPEPEILAAARDTLFAELDSRDPRVRRAAVTMLRYEGSAAAYERIAALFRDFAYPIVEPGLPLYQMEALATLHSIDPERTLRWLQSHNDEILGSFDLYALFSAIGFSRMPDFDNLFLYTRAGYGTPSPRQMEVNAIHVSEMYLRTGEEKYRKTLAYSAGSGFEGGPEELRRLYEYLDSNGLPVEPVRFLLEERGGVRAGQAITMRSFTLEELLFQALLFRFGYTDEVYRTRFDVSDPTVSYAPEALEKYGIEAPRSAFRRVLGELSVFPSLALNEAAAYLYAGVPRPSDGKAIVDSLAALPPADRLRYVQIIVQSPESELRRTLLRRYAASGERDVRNMVLAALAAQPDYRTRSQITAQLQGEDDPDAIAWLLQTLGNQDLKANQEVFSRYLEHASGIVRCAAAGQLLRSRGRAELP